MSELIAGSILNKLLNGNKEDALVLAILENTAAIKQQIERQVSYYYNQRYRITTIKRIRVFYPQM